MGNTDYLFDTPNVLKGIGRTVDLFGSLDVYNYSGEASADTEAIMKDWQAIGLDLDSAIRKTVVDRGKNKPETTEAK